MSEFSNILKMLILSGERGYSLTLSEKRKLVQTIEDIEEKSKRIILLNTAIKEGLLSREDIETVSRPTKNIIDKISTALYYGERLYSTEISFLVESSNTCLMNIITAHHDVEPDTLPLVVLRLAEMADRPILLVLTLREMEKRGKLKEFILDFRDMEIFYHERYNLSYLGGSVGDAYEFAMKMWEEEVFRWTRESMSKIQKFLVNYGLVLAQVIFNTPEDEMKDALKPTDPIWTLCYLIDINISKNFTDNDIIVINDDDIVVIKYLLKYSPYFVIAFFECLFSNSGENQEKLKVAMREAFNEGIALEYDEREISELTNTEAVMILEYWTSGEWMNRE